MEFQFLFGNPRKKRKPKKGGNMAKVKRVRSRSTVNTKAKANPKKRRARRRRKNPEKLILTKATKSADGSRVRNIRQTASSYPTKAELQKVKKLVSTRQKQVKALERGIKSLSKGGIKAGSVKKQLNTIQKQLRSPKNMTPAKWNSLVKKEEALLEKIRKDTAKAGKYMGENIAKLKAKVAELEALEKKMQMGADQKKSLLKKSREMGWKLGGTLPVNKGELKKLKSAVAKAEKALKAEEKKVSELLSGSKPKRKKASKKVAKKATRKKTTKKKATRKASKKKTTRRKKTTRKRKNPVLASNPVRKKKKKVVRKKKATAKRAKKTTRRKTRRKSSFNKKADSLLNKALDEISSGKKKRKKKATKKKATRKKVAKKKTSKKKATRRKTSKKKTTRRKTSKKSEGIFSLANAKKKLGKLMSKGGLGKGKRKSIKVKSGKRRYEAMVKRTNPTYSLKQAKNEGVKGLVQSYLQADVNEIIGFGIGGMGHGFTNDLAVKIVGDVLGQRALLARVASMPMGDAVFPLLGIGLIGHGLLKFVGPKAGMSQDLISKIIKGWSAATIVGSGIKAYDMVAPSIFAHRSTMPMSGVDYTPMGNVDFTPMNGVDYTPMGSDFYGEDEMGSISVVDPGLDAESPADFGMEESPADFGMEESPADFGMEDEFGSDFY